MKKSCFLFGLSLVVCALAHAGSGEESVDLQWAVCEPGPQAVLEKMDKGEMDAPSVGSVTYYDAEGAAFLLGGVTFRKKEEGSQRESSVKIRRSERFSAPGAECSWDRYGADEVYTCEVASEGKAGQEEWTQAQRDFLSRYYHPAEPRALLAYGPFENRKWHFKYKDYKVSFDNVDAGQAGQIMEFSLKVAADEADHLQKKFTEWLRKREITLCPRQESKTTRIFRNLGILRPGQKAF